MKTSSAEAEEFEKCLEEAGRRRQEEAAKRRSSLNGIIGNISQIREPQTSNLSFSSSSSLPDNSSQNLNTLKVYEHTVGDGTAYQFRGETPWENILESVFDNPPMEFVEAASEMSDNEFHRRDHDSENDEDWDDEECDDRSFITAASHISKASCSSHASNLTAKSNTSLMTTNSQGSQRKKKHSDEEIKIAAYGMTFCEMSRPCKCAQPCSDNLKFAQVYTTTIFLTCIAE